MPRYDVHVLRTHLVVTCFASALLASAQPPPPNYDEAKVGSYRLPDPLVFANGKPVRNAAEWKARRTEILGLFQANVFGKSPDPPRRLDYEVLEQDNAALGGKAVRQQVSIRYDDRPNAPKQNLLVYIPADAKGPVPVILTVSFFGNHMVSKDPGIRLGSMWNPKTGGRQAADANMRGAMKDFRLEDVLGRGYAFATFYYQDIEPDFLGGYPHGIRPHFLKAGRTEPAPDEWGAIGAWSYAVSRAIDYLEKEKRVDAKRIAVLGHSRLGKTALWAGAQDPRIAMVIANQAGEGGASLARRNYGETLRNLADRFPYWFCGNFGKMADQPSDLPVDMHETMPPLNQPIHRTLGFHYRSGKHEVNAYDWEQFLKFADMHLMSKQ